VLFSRESTHSGHVGDSIRTWEWNSETTAGRAGLAVVSLGRKGAREDPHAPSCETVPTLSLRAFEASRDGFYEKVGLDLKSRMARVPEEWGCRGSAGWGLGWPVISFLCLPKMIGALL